MTITVLLQNMLARYAAASGGGLYADEQAARSGA